MKKILIGSLFFSILHSILFWNQQIGNSLVIFVGLLCSYFYCIIKEKSKLKNKKALLWLIPILLLSSTYFIFYNVIFRMLNGIIIPILVIIMLIELEENKIEAKGFIWNILGCFVRPINKIGEATEKVKCARENKTGKLESLEKIKRLLKSLLVVIPIIIIVLILLSSADDSFANIFNGIGDFINNILWNGDIVNFIIRIFIMLCVFFYILSFSYQLIIGEVVLKDIKTQEEFSIWTEDEKKKIEEERKIRSNLTNKLLLISLNFIYLIFILLQLKHLIVTIYNANENFEYANYARQGFFQLMIVSLINFAVIIKIKCQRCFDKKDKKLIIGEILLLFFTVILIFIAGIRMFLYEQEFGYTYLRVLVYYILITEFLITIPIFLSLFGKKVDVFRNALIIITITYVALNFINIDNLIARNNINRYLKDPENISLDINYILNSTGIDATGQKVRVLSLGTSNLSSKAKDDLENKQNSIRNNLNMLQEYLSNDKKTFFKFNLSEYKAKNILNRGE